MFHMGGGRQIGPKLMGAKFMFDLGGAKFMFDRGGRRIDVRPLGRQFDVCPGAPNSCFTWGGGRQIDIRLGRQMTLNLGGAKFMFDRGRHIDL